MRAYTRRLVLAHLLLVPGLGAVITLDQSVALESGELFLLTMVVALAAGLIADRLVYGPVMDRPRPDDRER